MWEKTGEKFVDLALRLYFDWATTKIVPKNDSDESLELFFPHPRHISSTKRLPRSTSAFAVAPEPLNV